MVQSRQGLILGRYFVRMLGGLAGRQIKRTVLGPVQEGVDMWKMGMIKKQSFHTFYFYKILSYLRRQLVKKGKCFGIMMMNELIGRLADMC